MSINSVHIVGNITRDPELDATPAGMSILKLGVAINERRKNTRNGEWEDAPVFVDCAMFGERAAKLQPYLHKGDKVAIEGKLRWSQWDDRDTGKKRSKLDIIINEIELMTGKVAPEKAQQPRRMVVDLDVAEDIPF